MYNFNPLIFRHLYFLTRTSNIINLRVVCKLKTNTELKRINDNMENYIDGFVLPVPRIDYSGAWSSIGAS